MTTFLTVYSYVVLVIVCFYMLIELVNYCSRED
jgi:hypothetical protein